MDNNGWAGRPGVPLNPDRDGWHWVESAEGPVPALWARPLWRHCRDFWDQRSPEWMEEQQWRYLRPCSPEDLSPAEVDARIAAAHKEWLAELNHDTDALMEAARDSALAEAAQALIEKYQSMVIRPNTPEAWRFAILQDLREMAGEKPEIITAAIRALSDTPSDMVPGQLAKQDLRSPDCIKQWPECESGAYDPRCCRFPKSCSCESGALKGEGDE